MSLRTFPFRRSERGGAIAAVTSLVCGKCGTEEEMVQPNGRFAKPEAVIRWFNGRGWSVGGRVKADRCPGCSGLIKQKGEDVTKHIIPKRPFVSDSTDAARQAREDIAALSKESVVRAPALKSLSDLAQLNAGDLIMADQPEGPTRDDRRLIFAKLEEVYLDESRGYDNGWTDHRVSTDLGVPRAWVELIRNENFGPTKDNPEIRELLVKIDLASKETRAAIRACKDSMEDLSKAITARDANIVWLQDCEQRMKDLERTAKNISSQVAR